MPLLSPEKIAEHSEKGSLTAREAAGSFVEAADVVPPATLLAVLPSDLLPLIAESCDGPIETMRVFAMGSWAGSPESYAAHMAEEERRWKSGATAWRDFLHASN